MNYCCRVSGGVGMVGPTGGHCSHYSPSWKSVCCNAEQHWSPAAPSRIFHQDLKVGFLVTTWIEMSSTYLGLKSRHSRQLCFSLQTTCEHFEVILEFMQRPHTHLRYFTAAFTEFVWLKPLMKRWKTLSPSDWDLVSQKSLACAFKLEVLCK